MVKYFSKPYFLAALFCCFIFYSGFFSIPSKNMYFSLLPQSEIEEIAGTILSSPSKTGSGNYYSAKLKIESVANSCGFFSADGIIIIYIQAKLVEAYFPGKLFTDSKNRGAYIYESGGRYLFSGSSKSNGFFVSECKENLWAPDILGKIDYFRALCRLFFKRLMYKWGNAGGLLLALLCGAREYTDIAIAENFKNAGLSHVLALSGMHLSMFSSIAVLIGNKIGRKKLTYAIRIIVLILFVWFAGFSPSLLRAFICSTLTLIALMSSSKNPDMLLILCFSFLTQSIISPDDIWNIGFQLSYGALTGIIISSRFFYKIYSKIFPSFLAGSFSASTGAQLITIPIALKYFGSFAPIGIISTAIVSPFITVFIYSGLILILLSLMIPAFVSPSGFFINFQYTIIEYLVYIFSRFPKWSIN